MARLAILFGLLLGFLGAGFYIATEMKSITALIPSFFGVALFLLGILAWQEKFRMHAMHGAALVSLIGVGIPAYRVIRTLGGGGEVNLAVTEQILMAILCGVFLILCVKSFIDARRRRKAAQAAAFSDERD